MTKKTARQSPVLAELLDQPQPLLGPAQVELVCVYKPHEMEYMQALSNRPGNAAFGGALAGRGCQRN